MPSAMVRASCCQRSSRARDAARRASTSASGPSIRSLRLASTAATTAGSCASRRLRSPDQEGLTIPALTPASASVSKRSAKVTSPSSTVAASQAAAIGSPSLFDHMPDTKMVAAPTPAGRANASFRSMR